MTLKFGAADALSNQPVGTVTFQRDNGILYGQDFAYCRNVPAGIEFQIFDLGGYWQLVAPGYGDMSGGGYGNGALAISKKHMPLEPKGAI